MKAAVLTSWEHIEIKDVPVPVLNEEECLIKVRYAGVCGSDIHIFGGHHPTAKAPVILSHEFTGTVTEIRSKNPTDIKIGDRVVVEPLISCGVCEACSEGNWHVCRNLKLLGIHADGGFAEYVKVPLAKVIKVDDAISDKAAALIEPFAVAFHVNQRAGMKNGDSVLVIGGGTIGLVVGMVAKMSGASKVVYSEINADRIGQIKSFGFNEIINAANENAMDRVNELTEGKGFDVVFEASGSSAGILLSTQACRIRGTVVPVGMPGKLTEFDLMKVIFKELSVIGSRVYTFNDFKKTVRMLENIVKEDIYNVENLISDIDKLDSLESSIYKMKQGKNLGKILMEI